MLQIVSSEVLCTPESSDIQQLTKHGNDDKTTERLIQVLGDIMCCPTIQVLCGSSGCLSHPSCWLWQAPVWKVCTIFPGYKEHIHQWLGRRAEPALIFSNLSRSPSLDLLTPIFFYLEWFLSHIFYVWKIFCGFLFWFWKYLRSDPRMCEFGGADSGLVGCHFELKGYHFGLEGCHHIYIYGW